MRWFGGCVVFNVLLYVMYYFNLNQLLEKNREIFLTCSLSALSYVWFNSCFEL